MLNIIKLGTQWMMYIGDVVKEQQCAYIMRNVDDLAF